METHGNREYIVFSLDLLPNGLIDLETATCNFNDSRIDLSGSYYKTMEDLIELNISSNGLSIEDLGIRFTGKETPVLGNLKGYVKVIIPERNLSDGVVTGRIEGKDLAFAPGNLPSPISDCSFSLDLSEGEIGINSWHMRIGNSLMDISGILEGWEGLNGGLNVRSEFFDMADLMPSEDSLPLRDGIYGRYDITDNLDLQLKLDISNGHWRRLEWKRLDAELDLRGREIQIKRSRVDMEHGILTLNGHVKRGNTSEIRLSSHIRLTDQPIDALLESIRRGDYDMKGSLTMEALIFMKGREKKDLIPSMTGTAKGLIEKGLIKGSNEGEDLHFESIGGDAVIDQGILRSENLVMRSPDFDAVASGEENLVERRHNLKVFIQQHGAISSLLSKIPIIGRILVGEERKSILTAGYHITGTWNNPKAKYVPVESISNGLVGTLKRLLLTPVKILEDLQDVSKNLLKEAPPAPENNLEKQ